MLFESGHQLKKSGRILRIGKTLNGVQAALASEALIAASLLLACVDRSQVFGTCAVPHSNLPVDFKPTRPAKQFNRFNFVRGDVMVMKPHTGGPADHVAG